LRVDPKSLILLPCGSCRVLVHTASPATFPPFIFFFFYQQLTTLYLTMEMKKKFSIPSIVFRLTEERKEEWIPFTRK